MNLPLDMRMLDWFLTEGFSIEYELNTSISFFWNNELDYGK